MGRPSKYSEEISRTICERLEGGESLRAICADDGMPSQPTVFKWIREHAEFSKQYACAREAQMEAMAEEILEIADDSSKDEEEFEVTEGVTATRTNTEAIQRSKLRVETRKWLMSKLAAKKYGDKLSQEISGPDGAPIQAAITVQFVRTDGTDQS